MSSTYVMFNLLSALEGAEAPLFVTHRHADRDSLGSALGLRAALGRGTICAPDGIAGPAKPLLETMGTKPVTDPNTSNYDSMVVLDAPSSDRIAPVEPNDPLLIDHHESDDLIKIAAASLVDTEAGATAELVARVVKAGNWDLKPSIALPLLVGLLDDTGFLRGASAESIETAVWLIGGLEDRSTELPQLIDRSLGDGERTARALGTLRANGYRASGLHIAITNIGGHEAAAANALLSVGVDLALVCSQHGDDVRVTARASRKLSAQLNLGTELLPTLAEKFEGNGGGHSGAGTAMLRGTTIEEVEATTLALLEQKLGLTFGAVSG
ncbi:DHH family phosphoesterase [Natrialbaceae archaeon A-CW1-1]